MKILSMLSAIKCIRQSSSMMKYIRFLLLSALMVGSGMVLTLSGERRPACVSISQRRSSFHVPLTLTPSDSGRRLEKLSAQDPKVHEIAILSLTLCSNRLP